MDKEAGRGVHPVVDIDAAMRRLGEAMMTASIPTREAVDAEAIAEQRARLVREASASLGRGDRRAHRRAVEGIRRLDRARRR